MAVNELRPASSEQREARVAVATDRCCNPKAGVGLLTGGGDKPYALGLAAALMGQGVPLDFIGSDELDVPELHGPGVRFLNLRGDQSVNVGALQKVMRVLAYYARLLWYAMTARPRVFHILWHNRFDFLDRTVLLGFYKLLGKRLVLTAHNVDAGRRDGNDTWLNRFGLRSEYRQADRIFVHTEMMKRELASRFTVPESKITVIPFGINNTLPKTELSRANARARLGLADSDKTMLFFGNIAPYKGLEFLVQATIELLQHEPNYRLIIAGRTKGAEQYWSSIQQTIADARIGDRVLCRVQYIPDEEVEIYFKAADLLVLPYRVIFQSGVLSLGYSFGLPVVVSDVGSLKEDILVGKTGLVCRPEDPAHLAATIKDYFRSGLYNDLENGRKFIINFANERYSWQRVGEITAQVYDELVSGHSYSNRPSEPSSTLRAKPQSLDRP